MHSISTIQSLLQFVYFWLFVWPQLKLILSCESAEAVWEMDFHTWYRHVRVTFVFYWHLQFAVITEYLTWNAEVVDTNCPVAGISDVDDLMMTKHIIMSILMKVGFCKKNSHLLELDILRSYEMRRLHSPLWIGQSKPHLDSCHVRWLCPTHSSRNAICCGKDPFFFFLTETVMPLLV